MKALKYLIERILGMTVRKNFFWGPVFGVTWFTIFTVAADFIAHLVSPRMVNFQPDEEVRIYIATSISLTVFYFFFGLILIYKRRVHRRFSVWVLYLLAVAAAFFRVTHMVAAAAITIISMLRGTNPFDPEIRERAIHGEEQETKASRPPPAIRRTHKAMMRHRSHNVATQHPTDPAERAKVAPRPVGGEGGEDTKAKDAG